MTKQLAKHINWRGEIHYLPGSFYKSLALWVGCLLMIKKSLSREMAKEFDLHKVHKAGTKIFKEKSRMV